MSNQNSENRENQNLNGHGKAVFTGALLGGVAGAITALLLAPQSGKATRNQIRTSVTEARDRAEEKVEGALEEIRLKAGQLKAGVSGKARDLKRQGQDVLAQQLDRVAAAAEAGKKELRERGD